MRRDLLPYYLSRAALSIMFPILVGGISWSAALIALALFTMFILYAHSGWFRVDTSHPLTPIRRDERALLVQRKALIAAIAVAFVVYFASIYAPSSLAPILMNGRLVPALSVLTYFFTQFLLLARA